MHGAYVFVSLVNTKINNILLLFAHDVLFVCHLYYESILLTTSRRCRIAGLKKYLSKKITSKCLNIYIPAFYKFPRKTPFVVYLNVFQYADINKSPFSFS